MFKISVCSPMKMFIIFLLLPTFDCPLSYYFVFGLLKETNGRKLPNIRLKEASHSSYKSEMGKSYLCRKFLRIGKLTHTRLGGATQFLELVLNCPSCGPFINPYLEMGKRNKNIAAHILCLKRALQPLSPFHSRTLLATPTTLSPLL